jgi:large repetitive protein
MLSVLATFWLTGLSSSAGQFKRPVYCPAGQRPRQVMTKELTSSGNMDLVFADYLSNQIVVLLGNGDGTFQKPIQFPAPSPISLTVGDFNGDGYQDLAVVETSAGDGSIGIFLGDGAGHFKLSATYRTGVAPSSVAAADFSGGGHLDLAVANNGGQSGKGSLMVFSGTGKGTFKKPVTYKITGSPWAVAAGDLNGDDLPDLAVSNLSGDVLVLMNDGTGKFLKPVTYNAGGGEVVDVKIADLRHDGRNDLAAVNDSKNAIAILLNKGDGTFKAASFYPTGVPQGGGVDALVIADFNLDGKLDLAAVNQYGDGALLYGNGNGTFRGAIPIKDGVGSNSAFSIAAGDFNNDGAPDLAIPIEILGKPKGKVAILLNTK